MTLMEVKGKYLMNVDLSDRTLSYFGKPNFSKDYRNISINGAKGKKLYRTELFYTNITGLEKFAEVPQ